MKAVNISCMKWIDLTVENERLHGVKLSVVESLPNVKY